jgi:hypothetical protein
MFDGEMSQGKQLKLIVRAAFVATAVVVALLAITWPYGHWVALVAGTGLQLSNERGLRALGSGDGGPGGGFVDQRRSDLKGRRILFAIATLAGVGGVIAQLVRGS